jgi:hypothetical protein
MGESLQGLSKRPVEKKKKKSNSIYVAATTTSLGLEQQLCIPAVEITIISS